MKRYLAVLTAVLACGTARADKSEQILTAGVEGGVVVVLGCEDANLLLEFGADDAYLVQGLDTSAAKVAEARAAIQEAGAYGRVSADVIHEQRLPYVDDLVNLIIVLDDELGIDADEIARVLCPGGVVVASGDESSRSPATPFAGQSNRVAESPSPDGGAGLPSGLDRRSPGLAPWLATVKPVPAEIDEWSHFLCGPDNNAVSNDAVVGPVSGLKWTCGPLWSRSHEFTSSLSVMVSAGGRVFYVVDEGVTSVTTPDMPERWVLVARDAFNGKELWRMPLPQWRSRLGGNTALRSVPSTAQRCVVADDDRLFVSALLGDTVQVLDAATGDVTATHATTEGTREFVQVGRSLLLYREEPDERGRGRIARVDADTGKLIWAAPNDRYQNESLAATASYVIYHNGQELVCLDFESGQRRWPESQASTADKRKPPRLRQVTFIVHEDLVLEAGSNLIVARQAETGEILWETTTGGKAMRGQDCFVARGYVWHAAGDAIVGYDLETGKPTESVDPTSVQSLGHHLRCYRAKATENYLITQYRGVEFVSIAGESHSQTDWARGACSFGVVPANGLLYVPPNPCFCYPGVKIRGLNALTTRSAAESIRQDTSASRLERGPAFGQRVDDSARVTASDWTTYRHDPMRHAATECSVGENLVEKWSVDLGTKPSPPVVACGRVYVAAKDQHTVHAMDASTGEAAWSFTTGGRVDSPPTLFGGGASGRPLCLFGSADGYLYCVTADHGELVWRFRAAPSDRRIVSFDQLESTWPVHGSVLVNSGVVYCTAGRSSMLDGGVWLYGLDPTTGEVLYETNVDTLSAVRNDAEGKPIIPSYVMDGGHADILVCEGERIFMGPLAFDLQLKRLPTPYRMETGRETVAMDISREPYIKLDPDLKRDGYEAFRSFHRWQEIAWPEMTDDYKNRFGGINLGDMQMGRHIAPTAGFLDDTWFNRTYWMYSDGWPGWYHAHRGARSGQLLVVGPEQTYALQSFPERNKQSPLFTPGTDGYLLVADTNDTEAVLDSRTRGATKGLGYTRTVPPVWYDWVPIRVRGMVLAGENLLVAGPPDIVPADDPTAAFEGRRGGVLRAVSAQDGTILSERLLDAPPVFDGLIAAAGCLYASTEDHRVVCLATASEPPSPEQQAALRRLQEEQTVRHRRDREAAKNREFGQPAQTPRTSRATGRRLPVSGRMSREGWRVVHASSVEETEPSFAPEKTFDGLPGTSWHSKWVGGRDPFPHEIVIDLGAEVACRGIHYLCRQDRAQNGRVRDYSLYVGTTASDWGQPVAEGTMPDTLDEQSISFEPVSGRFIRLVVKSGYDENLTAISELNVLTAEPQSNP